MRFSYASGIDLISSSVVLVHIRTWGCRKAIIVSSSSPFTTNMSGKPLDTPDGQAGATTKPKSHMSYFASLRRSFLLQHDYRARLPPLLSRFTGYKAPGAAPPYPPLPIFPFTLLPHIPIRLEVLLFSTIGAFVGILLTEALSISHTAIRDFLHSPFIVASFGATAVLLYGVVESPLAQPRNAIGGQVISAIIGVALTRLFALDHSYIPSLDNTPHGSIHGGALVNGALSMAVAFAAMDITGTVHPPGGATALIAATNRPIAEMSWKYIPVVLICSLVNVAWGVLWNNLGRRRYPVYWWSPRRCFVVPDEPPAKEDEEIALSRERSSVFRQAVDGGGEDAWEAEETLSPVTSRQIQERQLQRARSAASSTRGGQTS